MNQEVIQEEEYDFPYHHLIDTKPFSETKHLFWGYKYSAYVEKVVKTLEGFKFDSLIEIGCGDGKVLSEIAKKYPNKKLVGTDYSEKSLRFARAFSPQLTFSTESKEKFDGFVLVEVIEHIDPKKMNEFLNSIHSNLNDKGFGIITTPSTNVPLNPKHYQHFDPEIMRKTLGNHFEILSCEYTSANTFCVGLIQRLFANGLFILNNKTAIKFLYNIYKKRYLHATPKNGTQLFVVVKKK